MEHRPLGRTGVLVSKLCLGAMMFGDWGTKDHDESIRIIRRALDAGINFIDTADAYSAGESEEIVGKALAGGGATTSCSPPRSGSRWARTTSQSITVLTVPSPLSRRPARAGRSPSRRAWSRR